MTGVNPGKHNIFGFIDRDPATYKQFIPTAAHMKASTLWEVLSLAGKRVIVVNVPVTYPPRQVNGILVSGFLSPSLDKAVYPASYLPALKSLGWRLKYPDAAAGIRETVEWYREQRWLPRLEP